MGVVAFDPSTFIEDFCEMLGSVEGREVVTAYPDLAILTPATYYILVQQSFETLDHVFVYPENQNRCLVSTEDISEWIEYLVLLIANRIDVVVEEDLFDAVDEYEAFYMQGGTPPEAILKNLLTDSLENDIHR